MSSLDRMPWRAGFGVSGLLIALALIPMAGASWFARLHMDGVAESERSAAFIRDQADELVDMIRLRAAILDERTWATATAGLESTGIPLDVAEQITGLSIQPEAKRAQTAVDELLERNTLPDIGARLRAIRNSPGTTLEEEGSAYTELDAAMAEPTNKAMDELLREAGETDGGSDLMGRLLALRSAVEMRATIASQQSQYFGTQFAEPDELPRLIQLLIADHALYSRAQGELDRVGIPNSELLELAQAISSSSDLAIFDEAVAQLSESAANPDVPITAGATTAIPDIGEIARVYEATSGTSDDHLQLVQIAGDDVIESAGEVYDSARAKSRSAIGTIGLVGLMSLLFVVGLTRFIVVPLRRLARGAQKLRDGDTSRSIRRSGPKEVRSASSAINETVAHLALAERQASALAEGDLQHPALQETSPGPLGASLQEAVQTLANSLSEREEFRKRLAHETTHDPLTRLPNRATMRTNLQRSLARTEESGATLAVLMIDVRRFKEINDRYGHPAGDRALQTISHRLRAAVRDQDMVARSGGDNFVVLSESLGDDRAVRNYAASLLDAVATPITVQGSEIALSGNVGVALTTNQNRTPEDLLGDAELALHAAAGASAQNIVICTDALRRESTDRASIEDALRIAIAHDELTLFYQPLVVGRTGALRDFEALVRWDRPGIGLTMPGEFVQVAERSDLINELDRWVVRQAVKQLREWHHGTVFADARISVNVSGRHLAAPDFVWNVLQPLDEMAIDPTRLIVEVTESALLEDLSDAAQKLQLLRDRGIAVAIDDFGTGYTSLAHLKTLPIDILKIDRSYVADPSARSLVQLIVDTGHLLGLSITAEGVETSEEAQAMVAMGCDKLQGWFFARPSPPADIDPLVGRYIAQLETVAR